MLSLKIVSFYCFDMGNSKNNPICIGALFRLNKDISLIKFTWILRWKCYFAMESTTLCWNKYEEENT